MLFRSFKGTYTSNELPHFISNMTYESSGNPALGKILAKACNDYGVETLAHDATTLSPEYGTLADDREFLEKASPLTRIGDVRGLRATQFVEDAGPLAHCTGHGETPDAALSEWQERHEDLAEVEFWPHPTHLDWLVKIETRRQRGWVVRVKRPKSVLYAYSPNCNSG